MAVADPVPSMDLTPYGCGCCGPECACVTCPDACPTQLCAIFEADGWTSALGDKVVSRINLPFDASLALIEPGSSGGYVITSSPPASIYVFCFPWGFRVYVVYGQQRFFPTRGWTAEYSLDVTVESCAEETWPRDLTVPLVNVVSDTAGESSPPSSVRVILSDPDVADFPDHANCCYYTESDFLCARLIAAVPATVSVAVTTTISTGPDPFAGGPFVCTLTGFVSGSNEYCWNAVYEYEQVIWSCTGCDVVAYIQVQVQGNFFPHRWSPASYPPPGTALVTVQGGLGIRTTGPGDCSTFEALEGFSLARYRAACESFSGASLREIGGWALNTFGDCGSFITVGWIDTFTVTEL